MGNNIVNPNDYYQDAIIIWLDPDINNPENSEYQNFCKNISKDFYVFTKTEDCIEKIKSIHDFVKTFIIISGSKFNEFSEGFGGIINEIRIAPEILIFTSFKRFSRIKENILIHNYPLLDSDSITFVSEEIQKRLRSIPQKEANDSNSKKDDNKNNEDEDKIFYFEYIEESNKLILPLHYQDFIEYPSKNEITKFNNFLLDNFPDLKYLIQQLLLKAEIPCPILAKYYLRAFTLPTNFYRIMNNCLIRKLGENYETYIKVLYHSLLSKYILPTKEEKLYRGAILKNSELEYIKNSIKKKKKDLPACLCYSKSFYSTTISEEKAFDFMLRTKAGKNEEYVLFEIDKGKKIDEKNISNSDIQNYSIFSNEEEILFFPFSNFEITNVSEKQYRNTKEYYRIFLSYLGKYRDKIDKNEKIPESEYTQNLLKTDILEKFEMDTKSIKFNFDIKTYIPSNKKLNSIQATYDIKDDDLNKKIKILNYNDSNKKEIEKLCNIYLKEEKKNFDFEYIFDKKGEYTFKFEFKDLLTSASKLFCDCNRLVSLDFKSFKTNYITDMSDMFKGCSLIKTLDLSDFKTNRLTNMKQMFCDCESLEDLDLSRFNTINVTDMSYMFNNCISLSFLNLSNFNTNHVKYMNGMFNKCESLINVNISNFQTNEVNNMSEMFSLCSSLESLDLSKFNTLNVTQMNKIFYQCSSLESLDLSKFDTLNVTQMNKMFYQCSSLESLNINNFKTEKVEIMENMFTECSSITSLDLSNFNTNEVKNMKEMFFKCSSLTYLNIINFNTCNVNNMENMFLECNSLRNLIISQNFKYKNKAFIGLDNNCKFEYGDKILNPSEINSFYKEGQNDISSILSKNIDDNDDNNSLNSSMISNFTNKLLQNNNAIKDKKNNNK